VSPPAAEPSDRFRILAIDGGGIRGLISALVLREIEQRLNRGAAGRGFASPTASTSSPAPPPVGWRRWR
jgi:hypothetical protein